MTFERNYEIVKGVKVRCDPIDMSRDELEDTLFSVAQFASQKLYESITLRRMIENINRK